MPAKRALPKAIASIAITLLSALVVSCGSGVGNSTATTTPPISTPTSNLPSIWVGAWGASPSDASTASDNGGGSERSFRFLITSTIDGTQARVKFANPYGATAVTIGAARIARGTDGSPAIDTSHDAALTFNGSSSTTIPAGGTVTSDPANISFGLGQVLAISVYLKGSFDALSRHDSYFITNYTTADGAGNVTANASGSAFTNTLGDWLLINEVDVFGPYQGTLAMFGSSTTDGFKSDYSSNHVYPDPNVPVPNQHADRVSDWMARRLQAAGYRIGVINAGIPGDAITPEASTSPIPGKRVAQDIQTIPNLLGVVSYFGSIDLRSSLCVSAPDIETWTQKLISTLAAANIPQVVTTLPPTGLCSNPAQANYGPLPSPADPYAGGISPGPPNGAEVQRVAFNQWVLTVAAKLPGVVAIADYDAALRDPQHPSFMLPQYSAGDNYHMNGMGYGAEANAVPLSFLPKP